MSAQVVATVEVSQFPSICTPYRDSVTVCAKRKAPPSRCEPYASSEDSADVGTARKVARLSSFNSTSTDGSACSDSSVCSLVHGVKAVRGGRPYMEDTYSVQSNLTEVTDASGDKLGRVNFYSVYDGHGGDYVAQHCSHVLHQHLKDEMQETQLGNGADINSKMEAALVSAFKRTDDDLKLTGKAALVGSTAVVVLVTEDRFWVANCGDSRALLCRDGLLQSLTEDHKPEREDERMRIKESGGFVVNRNGVVRVMGALSVSRAIGDHVLQRYGVTAHPDVFSVPRSSLDEFLILASDGLFSVLTNEEAITLARRSLLRARSRGASRDAAARIAANVLTKVALHRGAQDNVTVVVVDVMRNSSDSSSVDSVNGLDGKSC